MGKQYRHLSSEERAVLQVELDQGPSLHAIGRRLGRSPSTLSREVGRSAGPVYWAHAAAAGYRLRRQRSVRARRLVEGTRLFQLVNDQLVYERWSPRQIAARLRVMPPDNPSQWISHEAIDAAIYAHPRGGLKKALVQALRPGKPGCGTPRTSAAKRSWVPEELRIVHRPEAVEQRLVPGHWEGDPIKGAFNGSCTGTMVERKTRFVVLCKMNDGTAEAALEGFTCQMDKLPAFLRERLTYDRGMELTCHEELMRRLKIIVWFADPHAPWQRGSNENTNGLLRQFLPKGVDLSQASQEYLNQVAKLMNGRPRKTLGWKTSAEAIEEEILQFKSPVALDS